MQKNIILLGGQLFNKGAQAMTFITVDEIKKRFPDHNIILISSKDYKREDVEKDNYKFDIMPEPRLRFLFFAGLTNKIHVLKKVSVTDNNKTIIDTLHNTEYVLDISGYRLGSDWGCDLSIYYCLQVMLSHMCGAKVYLMPQSFGPFLYKGRKAKLTNRLILKCLPYAELIMAREIEGYNLLRRKYKLKNVIKTYDMVLQNEGVDISNIYHIKPQFNLPEISCDSIAIIPNSKLLKYGSLNEIDNIYDSIIDTLHLYNKKVYFLFHSSEDREICINLYEKYKKSFDDIYFIDVDLSCLEFDRVVAKFDFVVASRYHSIVHAYRNSVPAIVLGWAIKYKELMKIFNQTEYHFNVRESFDIACVKDAVIHMISDNNIEKEKIKRRLNKVREINVFDYINNSPY